jgi:LacI family transcriptional regulator
MATTQEIAKLCGVSRTTVWAVLNGKGGVSPATRDKVLEAVRRQAYHPPSIRRSLTAHFSKVIAFVVRDVSNPFFAEISIGIREVLGASGYHMLFQGSDVRLEDEAEPFEMYRSFHIGGYIVSSMGEGAACSVLRRISEEGTPVVAVASGRLPGVRAHVVSTEPREGSRAAVEHLIQKGHRRIAYLAGPPKWTDDRVLGFVEALLKHELKFEDSMIIQAGDNFEQGYRAALQALQRPGNRPTALACFNDLVAMGAYRAAHEQGLRIPEDLSVTGYDNLAVTAILGPPLTTVADFPIELGRVAAQILVESLRGEHRGEPIYRTVPVKLVERESVRQL